MEFGIVGKIDNWMSLRDKFIEFLEECDTEMKLNRFVTAIIISVGGVEGINKTRKELKIPPLSKKEVKEMKKQMEGKKK